MSEILTKISLSDHLEEGCSQLHTMSMSVKAIFLWAALMALCEGLAFI